MKFVSLPAFVLSLASVSVATSIQQSQIRRAFVPVLILDSFVPKQSLIDRSSQVPSIPVGGISADDWAMNHVMDQCQASSPCIGIATYEDPSKKVWVGYLVRKGATVDYKDFQPGPPKTTGARAFRLIEV